MNDQLFALYLKCFPDYPVTKAVFDAVLKPNEGHLIPCETDGKLIGAALVHGNSIALLCVEEAYRRRGIGSALLRAAEEYIAGTGADRIILGRGPHYLLQGVPAETEDIVRFFAHRGYHAGWTSVNMALSLNDFSSDALNIPVSPKEITFRFAEKSDQPALLAAVEDADSSWVPIFETCTVPILLAERNGKIVGFEILSIGGQFLYGNAKVGEIGCVGVIHAEREKGIGRRMVAKGAEWLKSQQCAMVELRYVYLVDWYSRIGFSVVRRQWMGEKQIMQ